MNGNGAGNGKTPFTIGGRRPDGTAAPVGPWWSGRAIPDGRPRSQLPNGGDPNGGDPNGGDPNGDDPNGDGLEGADVERAGGFVDEEIDAPAGRRRGPAVRGARRCRDGGDDRELAVRTFTDPPAHPGPRLRHPRHDGGGAVALRQAPRRAVARAAARCSR